MRTHVRLAVVGLTTAIVATLSCAPARAAGHDDPSRGPLHARTAPDNRHASKAEAPGLAARSGAAAEAVPVYRLEGVDRITTAIDASQFGYNDASATDYLAEAVVLTRSDDYGDALGGSALAGAAHGPLLLTPPTSLDTRVETEIKRVLGTSGTVYVLGGTGAVSDSVEQRLAKLGFTVKRLAGVDRFSTSEQVARETDALNGGTPQVVFVTTGSNFPDGLAAGATAGSYRGSVVLSADEMITGSVKAYLDEKARAGVPVEAVGGPAASAAYEWTEVYNGVDRYDTAAQLATAYWATPEFADGKAQAVGLATGLDWPDALSGGAFIGGGGPLLLTRPDVIPPATRNATRAVVATYVPSPVTAGFVFGGASVVSDTVAYDLIDLLNQP